MSRLDAVNYISHGIAKAKGHEESRTVEGADDDAEAEKVVRKGREALDAYCVDLNRRERDGRIDPLNGRAAAIDRTIQVLCRRTKKLDRACWSERAFPCVHMSVVDVVLYIYNI